MIMIEQLNVSITPHWYVMQNPANYHGKSELLSISLLEYESPTHMILDFRVKNDFFFHQRKEVWSEKAERKKTFLNLKINFHNGYQ